MVETNFKHTEIGLIPHDWEVKTLEEIADVKTGPFGSALHASDYVLTGTPIITVEHIGNFRISKEKDIPQIGEADKKRLSAYSLKEGDIVFSRVGSVDRCSYVSDNENGWLFSGRLLRVRPSFDVSSKYLVYHLSSVDARNRVLSVAVGLAMPSINTRILQGISVSLPPTLAEQERIAGALSSIDTLIGALNEQIEKKRHIKQGTMQQLLTGKKRLAGFTGEWKNVRLGEICEFSKGKGLKKEYLTNSGQYKCILYGEIFTIYDGIIKSVVSRTDVYEGTPSKKGDVLMPGSTTTIGIDLVKAVALNEDNILLGGDVIILRTKEESTCADFLAYLISNVDRNKVADVTQGITIIHLHAKNLVDITYSIPPTIAEQSAIAAVLSGMDTEIAALEQKRDKYIAIKSGMMQDLLTGKIRLV